MASSRPGLRAILSPAARRDIRDVLIWSEVEFGHAASLRYEALLIQAIRDVEEDAERPGVSGRSELEPSIRLYPLAFSRRRVEGRPVKEPRHLIAFRRTSTRLDILRVLHDSSDLRRHLPSSGD